MSVNIIFTGIGASHVEFLDDDTEREPLITTTAT